MYDEKSAARDHKETHGMGEDIDGETSLDDVKAPNVFERVKEEVGALVQTIHPKNKSQTHGTSKGEGRKDKHKQENPNSGPDSNGRTPNFIEKAKKTIEKIMHHEKTSHYPHKETHGTSDDIDKNTPIDEVKGTSVFERAKEEIEVVFQALRAMKGH